jgi:hypothetical protein
MKKQQYIFLLGYFLVVNDSADAIIETTALQARQWMNAFAPLISSLKCRFPRFLPFGFSQRIKQGAW